jgi:hypothetical protein
MIIVGDLIDVNCINVVGANICDTCVSHLMGYLGACCSSDSDTIADPKLDYTNLYNFLNLFIQSTKFITLRSHVELDRWGRPGIWYEELYDFAHWKHFTTGRKITRIEFQGKIFTYFELPSFSLNKKKIRVPKQLRNTTESAMVSSDENNNLTVIEHLNPKASQFNGYFKMTDLKDCDKTLRKLRVHNVGNVVIAHLNINSVRNKFDLLVSLNRACQQ